jgi:hypothetical protein
MPNLPAPINHTVDRIYAVYARKPRFGDSAGVSMSDAVNPCDAAIWLTFRWVAQPEPFTGQKRSLFETGLYWEGRLLDDLEAIGGDVMQKQKKVQLADGHLRGKLDGVATGIPEAPVAEHVVECKSHNLEQFRKVVKHKVEKGKPEHYGQCQLYMHGSSIDRALYLAVCRDDDARYSERIKYDVVYCVRIEQRVSTIVHSPTPPAKNESFACEWCKSRAQCKESAWSRVNCRTCLHSAPCPAGEWRCEKHGKALDYKEQQAGCGDHRFIPALVPGEQVDVDGDLVIYRMTDGSQWIDGMRESA